MIGILASCLRISWITSKPLLPGMFQSVSTRSKSPGLNKLQASTPSAASVA
jgi:hypothetical protein